MSNYGNYNVETTGSAFWDTSESKELLFSEKTYVIEFAELEPERFEFSHISIVNDHSVRLKIDSDPYNLINK